MRSFWLAVLVCLLSTSSLASEREHQEFWCTEYGGTTQVELVAGTRADCVTATHAVEVEQAGSWGDALGRALDHARLTGLRAGVVLIVEDHGDQACLSRLRAVTQYYHLPVDVWTVR